MILKKQDSVFFLKTKERQEGKQENNEGDSLENIRTGYKSP